MQICKAEFRTQGPTWNRIQGLTFLIMDSQAIKSFPFSRGQTGYEEWREMISAGNPAQFQAEGQVTMGTEN